MMICILFEVVLFQALGKIKDPSAVDPLIQVLKDRDSQVRDNAIRALGEIKDPSAVGP